MARVGIDLDGVVYDFAESVFRYMDEHYTSKELPKHFPHVYGEPQRWEFYEDWGMSLESFLDFVNKGVDAGRIFGTGAPRAGAREALQLLKSEGHTLVIVTDRRSGSAGKARLSTLEWLDHWGLLYDEIHFDSDKTAYNTDYFVEDKLENYQALTTAGVDAYLVDRPWNRTFLSGNDGRQRVDGIYHFAEKVVELEKRKESSTGVTGRSSSIEPAPKESICAEADRIVGGERRSDYGHPFDNFAQTGQLWAAILGLDEVTPEQVGLCMVAVKLSRHTNAPKRDNLVDIAGYAKTLDLIAQRRAEDDAVLDAAFAELAALEEDDATTKFFKTLKDMGKQRVATAVVGTYDAGEAEA